MAADKFISIEGIAKRYGATAIFEDLWLAIPRGGFTCVIGHSGCGKTTVLNILAGLDQPSEGVVRGDALSSPRPACGERSPRSCAAGEGVQVHQLTQVARREPLIPTFSPQAGRRR